MARIKSITPVQDSGLDETLANEIFDQISLFAGYGFNKSHAAAYAAIAFKTAYLKTHYPEAFFAAAMNLDLDEVDEIATFASELREREIHLWSPDINASRDIFTPIRLKKSWKGYDYAICYALSAIRGVGQSAARAIVEERNTGGVFASVQDFTTRMGNQVGKTALKALAKSGAFDCFKISRAEAMAAAMGRDTRSDARQVSMFDLMEDAGPQLEVEEMTRDEELDAEFDVLGHYMTGHPLDELKPRLFEERLYFSNFVLKESKGEMRKARLAAVVTDVDVRRTRSGDLMAVISLSDPEATYEALAFSETWSAIASSVQKKARLVIDAAVSIRGDERRLIVENVEPVPSAEPKQGQRRAA